MRLIEVHHCFSLKFTPFAKFRVGKNYRWIVQTEW